MYESINFKTKFFFGIRCLFDHITTNVLLISCAPDTVLHAASFLKCEKLKPAANFLLKIF